MALDPGFGARTAPVVSGPYPSIAAPRAGKLSKLYITAFTGPGTSSIDFTVYVDGNPTAITCELAASGTSASDLSHSVSVTEGQKITVHGKGRGGISAGAAEVAATLLFTNG